ncbi:hypothetical protein C8Q74DRAFT_1316848 [Fomes fomentarius]|nr:hypothetical protein C8Q74DRAFT_1316848 [Fomes fomentarius]
MATVIDVSGRLGEYMLKGWVLTDRICSKCAKVPLMRSPSSAAVELHFCINCDPAPSTGSVANISAPQPSPSRTPAAPQASAQYAQSVSSTSNSNPLSRSSTPPTEVSHAPSSPLFAPVMDPIALLRRRQQSDTASAEIGRRMLKGWAMLAEECPSPDCYGVPLVRPPRTGTTVDPRKECVICGIVYIDEKDAYGQDQLVPALSPAGTYRPLNGSSVGPSASLSTPLDEGKAGAHSEVKGQAATSPRSHTSSALETTARSLEETLIALSARLNSFASASIVDPSSIGQTADAISKVSQALAKVKELLWSEHQALMK